MMRMQGYPDAGPGLRLHLNENTGGCSPRVLEAIRRLEAGEIARYPSYEEHVLACARHFGVDPEWLLLTNGLDEGILVAAVAHIARPRLRDAEAIVPLPAFDLYESSTRAAGATAVPIPPAPDFTFPTPAVLGAVTPRTRMIFLNTPNNPSGRLIAVEDIARVAAAAPHALVFVDEAYIEFGGATFVPHLPRFPNVLVGRTFSKAYGLAGIRLGAVMGQPSALDPLRAVVPAFTVNAVALAAVAAALGDAAFLSAYAAEVRESRARLYAACRRLALEHWASAGNYVMVRIGEAKGLVATLAARGVHVRDRTHDPVTPGCIRITAGRLAHTEAAIEALEAAMAGE